MLLGEANIVPRDDDEYFAGGEGLHMIFNFWVNQHLFLALATGDARPLEKSLRETAKIPVRGQWAHFLRNHDELDLGRLSAEERERVMNRFAPDPSCSCTGAGSAAGSPRCSATAGSSSSPTASCSRCPERR